MASGVELGLACFTAFKEVYLLGKFVHKTYQSVQNSVKERDELCNEFKHEMLWLQSFGRVYIQNNGVMSDQGLDADWLRSVQNILERLRSVFMDYSKIAGSEDEEYRKFSPYLSTAGEPSKLIEFNLDLDESPPTPSASLLNNVLSAMPMKTRFSWTRNQPLIQSRNWKWALWQKRKFRRVLRDFKAGLQLLKDLVPLSIAANPRYSKLTPQEIVDAFIRVGLDGDRIGLRNYLEIRRTTLLEAEAESSEFDELIGRQNQLSLLEGTVAPEHEDRLLTTGVLVPRISEPNPSPSYTAAGSVTILNSANGNRHDAAPAASLKQEHVFIEYKNYVLQDVAGSNRQPSRKPAGEEEVHRLSAILQKASSVKLLTLPFRGFLNESQKMRFAFIFDYPEQSDGTRPISLNEIITKQNNLPLPTRFAIAQKIAVSLGAFHAVRWVHKSIRSHSILFFREKNSKTMTYHNPYLVGFEFSRPESGPTNLIGDEVIEYNLYRHKHRLWENPTTAFNRMHDIYALGVVLLEIGLWKPARDIYAEFATKSAKLDKNTNGEDLKEAYRKAARQLRHTVGEGFTKAVEACLTAGDAGADNLLPKGNPMEEAEGQEAMLFRKKVVRNLDISKIADIDEDEDDEDEVGRVDGSE